MASSGIEWAFNTWLIAKSVGKIMTMLAYTTEKQNIQYSAKIFFQRYFPFSSRMTIYCQEIA